MDTPGSLDVMAAEPSPLSQIRARRATGTETVIELTVGLVLLGVAAIAGVAFIHRPWPNRLDRWGDHVLPADLNSRVAHDFATLGSMRALIAGVVLVFLVGMRRDRARAIACAAAPVVAVLIVQEIAKPLVDRHNILSTGFSYPSGTVTAVAALATALTLVSLGKTRLPVALLSLLALVGTSAAVIVLRWHYPTDALGGAAVGVGSVLALDALLHIPRLVSEGIGSAHSGSGEPATYRSGVSQRSSFRPAKVPDSLFQWEAGCRRPGRSLCGRRRRHGVRVRRCTVL